MAATKQIIRDWLQRAPKGTTHMVVVCDTFDYDDYPIYVKKGHSVADVVSSHDGINMQKVMEVYNLSLNIEDQLKENRAMHL